MSRVVPLLASVLVSLLIAAGISEAVLRLFSKEAAQGAQFRGSILLPKDWNALRSHMSEVWKNRSHNLAYLVYDPEMGWTVGPNRQSTDGRYRSGPEGLRTSEVGESYRGLPPKTTVAVMGDSFAFGEQVLNADTFASRMQEGLGADYRVLNFGVPGFGVDQSYLRYLHDAMPWQPDIAVLTFVWHDMFRTLSVYTAIAFPHWDMPFSKPRFAIEDGKLVEHNVPAATPEAIYGTPRIQDLPLLDLAIGYDAHEWGDDWRHYPYLARFVLTQIARMPGPHTQTLHRPIRPELTDNDEPILSLNRAIVAEFSARARAAGTRPIVVYLPSRDDYHLDESIGREFASTAGLGIFDAWPCLEGLTEEQAFVEGDSHYTPRGNAAIGACIAKVIGEKAATASAPAS
jgi:hypothetical protein